MKLKKISIALLMFGITFSSCKKDEVVTPTPAEKCLECITGSWSLTKYYRNGVDETSKVLITNYVEIYTTGKTYTRTYIDGDKKAQSDNAGNYTFNTNKDIEIKSVSSISKFSNEHTSLSASVYSLDLLNSSELRYSFTNGGATHQFRLTKK